MIEYDYYSFNNENEKGNCFILPNGIKMSSRDL